MTEYELIFKHGLSANTLYRMKNGETITTKTLDTYALFQIVPCLILSNINVHNHRKKSHHKMIHFKYLLQWLLYFYFFRFSYNNSRKTYKALYSSDVQHINGKEGLFSIIYLLPFKEVLFANLNLHLKNGLALANLTERLYHYPRATTVSLPH